MDINQGVYGSTLISNDLMKRKVTVSKFNYLNSYNDYKHVNYNFTGISGNMRMSSISNNPRYSERSSSFVKIIPRHFGSFDVDGLPLSNYSDDRQGTELQRRSQMGQINSVRLEILVNGDSQRKVGEVVKIIIPAIEEQNDEQGGRIDGLLSGKYLVSKVKHTILSKAAGYKTTLQLVKEGLVFP